MNTWEKFRDVIDDWIETNNFDISSADTDVLVAELMSSLETTEGTDDDDDDDDYSA